jgi:hypothetical protein
MSLSKRKLVLFALFTTSTGVQHVAPRTYTLLGGTIIVQLTPYSITLNGRDVLITESNHAHIKSLVASSDDIFGYLLALLQESVVKIIRVLKFAGDWSLITIRIVFSSSVLFSASWHTTKFAVALTTTASFAFLLLHSAGV